MNKVKLSLLLSFIVIVLMSGCSDKKSVPYSAENSMGDSKSKDDSISVVDYPLIDVQIRYNEADIKLIIANDVLSTDQAVYLYTNDKEVLEQMQTEFNVSTFPKGHGTTPDSYVYVYQGNELIKEIPFVGSFNNDEKFVLSKLTNEDVEKSIHQQLPQPF